MKIVFEAVVAAPAQRGGKQRQLYTSKRKAHRALEKFHAHSAWATVPMPPLSDYRQKLRQFSSHSIELVNAAEEAAELTITARPLY